MVSASLVAVMCALLVPPVLAAEVKPADALQAFIPPGQEELLGTMLGKGLALPECELVDGKVNYTTIEATYACVGDWVVVELAHRSTATATATSTDFFAITPKSGSPPRGLVDALASLVRSREADFKWGWPAQDRNTTADDAAYPGEQ
jgi:hypothetical protein